MQDRIVKFIAALRSSGVRVSLAETTDALNAIDKMGIADQQTFRLSLQATLIKEAGDLPIFNELFPLFFNANQAPPLMNIAEDLTPEEAQKIAEALRQFNQRMREALEKLLEGEPLSEEELERLGEMAGMQNASNLRYQNWMARRMEQAMRFEEVRQAIQELMETLAEFGMDAQRREQLERLMAANQAALSEQLRQYAGQRIAENLSERPRDENIDQLMERPFNALSEKDMKLLHEEVRRLATVLRSRVALRQKRAKSGKLDPKATIRANLKHGGVPFHIKHRNRHLKPKLVVICDISTSMRYCSELMISLIHAMQDQISKVHAFAFIDHLEYVTPDLTRSDSSEAVEAVLRRMPPGYYSTDLGYSLTNFASDHMDKIDSRTTFLMVGDGRNNYNNPQIEIFRRMARRSHRTIWINPEPRMQWGTGDSDMREYERHCDDILKAATLKELTSAVDKLLAH